MREMSVVSGEGEAMVGVVKMGAAVGIGGTMSSMPDMHQDRVEMGGGALGPMSQHSAPISLTGRLQMHSGQLGRREGLMAGREGRQGVASAPAAGATPRGQTATHASPACAPAALGSGSASASDARPTGERAGRVAGGGTRGGDEDTGEAAAARPMDGEGQQAAWAAWAWQGMAAVVWLPWLGPDGPYMRGFAADSIGADDDGPRLALRDFGQGQGERFWERPLFPPPPSGRGRGRRGRRGERWERRKAASGHRGGVLPPGHDLSRCGLSYGPRARPGGLSFFGSAEGRGRGAGNLRELAPELLRDGDVPAERRTG